MATTTETYALPLDYDRLQSIRLAHAIAEAGIPLAVPVDQLWKLSQLADAFSLDFHVITPSTTVLSKSSLYIDHATPRTRLGSVERSLIFPHAITERCRDGWTQRDIAFSFAGLLTEGRLSTLSQWIPSVQSKPPKGLIRTTTAALVANLRLRISRSAGLSAHWDTSSGPLCITHTAHGRTFPGKTWDTHYLHSLQRSRFAICLNGDFVWSYRFFEAVLCGAIPIVQEPCAAYDGFKFLSLTEPALSVQWSTEIAEHNYTLAVNRLTVPRDDLVRELQLLRCR